MPSPTMATVAPCSRSDRIAAALPSGRTSARTWSAGMPDLRPRPPRRCARRSPVSIQTSRPSAASCSTAARDSGRMRVGDARSAPTQDAVGGRRTSGVAPAAAIVVGRARSPSAGVVSAGCRRTRARPSTRRRDPGTGDRLERWSAVGSDPAARGRPRRSPRQRVLAAGLGGGRQPQQLVLGDAVGGTHAGHLGRPRVRVPVLSSTIGRDARGPPPAPRRRGSGCRARRPCRCRP